MPVTDVGEPYKSKSAHIFHLPNLYTEFLIESIIIIWF